MKLNNVDGPWVINETNLARETQWENGCFRSSPYLVLELVKQHFYDGNKKAMKIQFGIRDTVNLVISSIILCFPNYENFITYLIK